MNIFEKPGKKSGEEFENSNLKTSSTDEIKNRYPLDDLRRHMAEQRSLIRTYESANSNSSQSRHVYAYDLSKDLITNKNKLITFNREDLSEGGEEVEAEIYKNKGNYSKVSKINIESTMSVLDNYLQRRKAMIEERKARKTPLSTLEKTKKIRRISGVIIQAPDGEIINAGHSYLEGTEANMNQTQEDLIYRLYKSILPFLYFTHKLSRDLYLDFQNLFQKTGELKLRFKTRRKQLIWYKLFFSLINLETEKGNSKFKTNRNYRDVLKKKKWRKCMETSFSF